MCGSVVCVQMAQPSAAAQDAFSQAQALAGGTHGDDEDDLDLHNATWDSVNFGGKDGGEEDLGTLDVDMEAGAAATADNAPLLQAAVNSDKSRAPTTPAPAAEPASAPQSTPMCACLTIAYYRPHFDVDTSDVVTRLKKGFIPSSGENSLLAEVQAKPDLYGPFWVCATLVFVIGVAANFASWVYWDKNTTWEYDFTHVTLALGVVFGYAVGMPGAVWLLCKYFGVPLSLITLLCLYGYSMVAFIPAAMLCTTPVEALDWLALTAAFGLSIAVLLRNTWDLLTANADPTQRKVFAGIMAVAHLLLAFMLKLLFFLHT